MIYQLNGKNINKKPKGPFKKVVKVGNKLTNYITEDTASDGQLIDFWVSKNEGDFVHVGVVDNTIYIDGVEL